MLLLCYHYDITMIYVFYPRNVMGCRPKADRNVLIGLKAIKVAFAEKKWLWKSDFRTFVSVRLF